VVLHHQVGTGLDRTDEDHLDWLFENGPTLITFATAVLANLGTAVEVECSRLPDHRIKYLNYQGKLPDKDGQRNRGSVTRIASGRFETIENAANCFSATLTFDEATKAHASVEFRRRDNRTWSLRIVQ
jgi:hypothetical protein